MYNYEQELRVSRFQATNNIKEYINDPDFLIIDNPTLSLDEKKSQFALWCSFSAPLLLSADITALTEEELAILTNKNLIAINQDTSLNQATLASRDGTWDVLTKNLANFDRLLTVLNRGSSTASLNVSWERMGFVYSSGNEALNVTDLWTGKLTKVPVSDGGIIASDIPPHGTAVFRIGNSDFSSLVLPTGLIFNIASRNCLTEHNHGAGYKTNKTNTVTWAPCDGSDGQTWVTNPDGHIYSLISNKACIIEGDNGEIVSNNDACYAANTAGCWTYDVSGNLINCLSGNCLTEDDSKSTATSTTCQNLADSQVLGLPVGVDFFNP